MPPQTAIFTAASQLEKKNKKKKICRVGISGRKDGQDETNLTSPF